MYALSGHKHCAWLSLAICMFFCTEADSYSSFASGASPRAIVSSTISNGQPILEPGNPTIVLLEPSAATLGLASPRLLPSCSFTTSLEQSTTNLRKSQSTYSAGSILAGNKIKSAASFTMCSCPGSTELWPVLVATRGSSTTRYCQGEIAFSPTGYTSPQVVTPVPSSNSRFSTSWTSNATVKSILTT